MQQSPIFSKTYDFILWLLHHTEKFPKHERFRMARRLEDSAFEFYELLIRATRAGRRKQAVLLDADLTLDKLRLYLRLSHARGLTTHRQYEHAAALLVEIGALLGGWLNTLSPAQAGR
ncbi:MAG: diversity-generating retroelement protein Avd [Ardenticatenales bacterium]|nr:diversity-generating retroelement protein Avd [Ardenticatenales bacterium]